MLACCLQRKIAAYVLSVGAAIQTILFEEYKIPGYEEEPHVFTPVRKAFKGFVNEYVYGIKPEPPRDNT
jgi:hypothetical protein